MKRNTLILLTFVPVVTGYILNLTLLIPGMGVLLYYLLPCITQIFWFYLGNKYSETNWNIIQSIMIGNGIGFLSLLLYFWQFWGCSDANRNLFLSALSQDFVANTNLITAKFALLFEAEKNTFSQTSATAMQILGLLLMIIIFILGFVWGKVKNDRRPS
ncbi:MAG: hypothetical protein AAGU75_11655 [Bacillota bacterium]